MQVSNPCPENLATIHILANVIPATHMLTENLHRPIAQYAGKGLGHHLMVKRFLEIFTVQKTFLSILSDLDIIYRNNED